LEYLILQCQSEVTPLVGKVLGKSLELIKYDPNYAGDEDEDEDMGGEDAEDEESVTLLVLSSFQSLNLKYVIFNKTGKAMETTVMMMT